MKLFFVLSRFIASPPRMGNPPIQGGNGNDGTKVPGVPKVNKTKANVSKARPWSCLLLPWSCLILQPGQDQDKSKQDHVWVLFSFALVLFSLALALFTLGTCIPSGSWNKIQLELVAAT